MPYAFGMAHIGIPRVSFLILMTFARSETVFSELAEGSLLGASFILDQGHLIGDRPGVLPNHVPFSQ